MSVVQSSRIANKTPSYLIKSATPPVARMRYPDIILYFAAATRLAVWLLVFTARDLPHLRARSSGGPRPRVRQLIPSNGRKRGPASTRSPSEESDSGRSKQ